MASRFAILGYSLSRESGESRLILNLARAIRLTGAEVTIHVLSASPDYVADARNAGIPLVYSRQFLRPQELLRIMRYDTVFARRLWRQVSADTRADAYIVAQDAALPIMEFGLPGRSIFLCQGDLSLLLLDQGFRLRHPVTSRILALGLVGQLRRHARWVERFDVLLANSEFTRSLASFIYDVPFQGVIYPPVDVNFFIPGVAKPHAPFALTVLRSKADSSYGAVCEIAKEVPMKVVGGASIPGAQNMGRVSDTVLRDLYASASVTISIGCREYFGYPILESLSCSTPVLALRQGGVTEMVQQGVNGWLMSDIRQLKKKAGDIFRSPYSSKMRESARSRALDFSIEATGSRATSLIGI